MMSKVALAYCVAFACVGLLAWELWLAVTKGYVHSRRGRIYRSGDPLGFFGFVIIFGLLLFFIASIFIIAIFDLVTGAPL